MKLYYSFDKTFIRNFGREKVKQTITLIADYYPEDHIAEFDSVNVWENGKKLCNIQEILQDMPGSPLEAMWEAIDWDQLYFQQIEEMKQKRAEFEYYERAERRGR